MQMSMHPSFAPTREGAAGANDSCIMLLTTLQRTAADRILQCGHCLKVRAEGQQALKGGNRENRDKVTKGGGDRGECSKSLENNGNLKERQG